MRAALYARVSSEAQDADDKTSLQEQMADMEAYCERRGLTITARYQEVGRGWSKNRPEFQRLLVDARAGRFDTIVCWKSDRLSRGMFPAAALMEIVEAYRINIEAVMDAIDMKTFGLMAAIGKIELDNFRERSSMGKRGAAKRGRIPVNKVPYGYRIGDDRKPEIVETEAKIVRRIYEMALDGYGFRRIAHTLIGEGVPSPSGAPRWWNSTIGKVLRDETYLGTWWYGKARYEALELGQRVEKQAPETWICVDFPVLVDREMWERVQELKRERKRTSKRNTRHFYLLQNLVRCEVCGLGVGALARVSREGKRLPEPRRFYKCVGSTHHGTKCRPHPYIHADELEQTVWSEVKAVLQQPARIIEALSGLSEQADNGAELKDAEKQVRTITAEEDRLIRLYVAGRITDKQLDHQRKFIDERLEMAREALDAARGRSEAARQAREMVGGIIAWSTRVADGLDTLTDSEKHDLLGLVLDRVTVDGENTVTLTLGIDPSPVSTVTTGTRS